MFETALLNFEDKGLQEYFFNNTLLMWIIDFDFQTILEVNHIASKTCGYSKEEIFLQSLGKILPEKEQQKLLQLASTSSPLKKEISLITHSGKKIHTETAVTAILLNGEMAWLCTMTDITEKKLYRDMLEQAIEEEMNLKDENLKLKKIAFKNFHLARKPLANILGLVNVLDQSVVDQSVSADQTLSEAIEFLRECSIELDALIKNTDPELY